MSKTIGSILLVAAAVAVNVVPGIGQAISATLIGAGLSTAAAASITAAVTTAVTMAGLQAGAGLLGLGPKLPKPGTTEGPIKTPIPRRVSAYGRSRLYGAYALYETASNGSAIDVFAVHDGRIDGIEQRYLGDDPVTVAGNFVQPGADGRYKDGAVSWYETLGQSVGTAFAQVIARLPGIWTANHRGDGVVAIATLWKAVKAKEFQETFPQQGPVPASIVARWQRVFDWRDGTQSLTNPDSWKWSENVALQLAHYRLVREKARRDPGDILPTAGALQDAWDLYFAPTLAHWTEAANVCDEAVTLKAGGTEPRYRSAFSHQHTDPHKDVIDALTACFDGWTAPRADGALVVYAGKYYEPTVTIGPAEIVSYNWRTGIDDENAVNEIPLTYISSEHDYTAQECTPWQDTDAMAARGEIRSQPLELAVPSHAQMRRLAKRTMARLMAPAFGTVTTNVAGRIARGQRYIELQIIEAGAVFFDGVAEITQLTRNLTTGGVTFAWVAADPNIDAWNPATEEGEPAAAGTRVAPAPLDAPTITGTTIVYADASSEGTSARVAITAAGPDRTDLTWFARWRVQGATIWNEQIYSDIDPGPSVELLTGFVPVGAVIEVEVAYQIGDGRVSPYSAPPTEVDSDMESVAPDAAASITLVDWSETLNLSTPSIPRASAYVWTLYHESGWPIIDTITTPTRTLSYTSGQAATAGARRSYVATVAGVNSAGTGTAAISAVLNKPAPAALASVAGVNGTAIGSVTFTLPTSGEIAGFIVFFSQTSGFDPQTEGYVATGGTSPLYIYGLAAGTYYARVAAFDLWTKKPSLLNLSAEVSFTVSTGGGSYGGGGGAGGDDGGGGGYEQERQFEF